jgi:hypothetical protein
MRVIRQRMPSKEKAGELFMVSVFFVHIWAILAYLYRIPIFANRTTVIDIIGIFAYVMVIALVDSILLFSVLTFINFMLPDQIFNDNFVGFGTIYLFGFVIWVIPVHLKEFVKELVHWNDTLYYIAFTLWFFYCITLIIVLALLLIRNKRFKNAIQSFSNRITVLSFFYLGIDLVCMIILIYRNFF